MASTGLDLALLHGGGQGSWVWKQSLAALNAQDAECFGRTIALDVPGCGCKRGRATAELSPADVVQELTDDLEVAGLKDIVLVGHSLAGNLLPAMAVARPDLFRRLVYVSCSIPLPGQTVIEMMGNGTHGASPDEVGWPVDPKTTAMKDRYAAMYCEDMDANEARSFVVELDGNDWPESFFSNRQFDFPMDCLPATYVVCEEDRILPAAWQRTFAKRFAADRVIRIDAGHQAMITRPHALAEILRHEAMFESARPSRVRL